MQKLIYTLIWTVLVVGTVCGEPHDGALDGNRYRVIVSSDIGGSDEDDDQSFVHYLLYSDLFDTEGLISSPPKDGRLMDFVEVIDLYEKDYPNLIKHSNHYPKPEYLRSISKQGATEPAPPKGFSTSTEGSKWIIRCAKRDDPRPLYVLVWGSITDVAQAVHDEPSLKDKIRVYFIASWNQRQDPHSYAYLNKKHPDLWMIHCNTTFRGWYIGGDQSGDLGNSTFVNQHVKGHGALGNFFVPLKGGKIKMGDTPSVAYLLKGDPAKPDTPHWGGRFVPKDGRPNWWVDDPSPQWKENNLDGAKTVNRWRQDYLRDWQSRMDRCLKSKKQK